MANFVGTEGKKVNIIIKIPKKIIFQDSLSLGKIKSIVLWCVKFVYLLFIVHNLYEIFILFCGYLWNDFKMNLENILMVCSFLYII